jgi:5-amino-6-(5-phospho-D-ribitylamino)uracil phosphatase
VIEPTREPYLFGIDLDGTLLAPDGSVRDRTKAAIHAVLAAGHKVAFATGRNYVESHAIFDIVEHVSLAVLVSGAVVVDCRDRKTVYRSQMAAGLAAELCAAIERHGYAAVALQDRHATGIDYLVSKDRVVHEALMSWMRLSGQVIVERTDLGHFPHEHTTRVSAVLSFKQAAELKSAIEQEFGLRAYVHGVIVHHEGAEILEMFDPRVNKWSGLKRVAELYGIPPERTVCVGDDQNDLPMIRNAGLGVAMGNARAEVKEIAKKVIGSNADDGLAKFLEDWLKQ